MYDKQINAIKLNNKMHTLEEIEGFRQGVNELKVSLPNSPDILSKLLLGFIDKTEHKEVMWSLLHLIESYEYHIYIKSLIVTTPLMIEEAFNWLKILYTRILNNEKTYKELIDQLSEFPYNIRKTVVDFLLNIIEDPKGEDANRVKTLNQKIEHLIGIIDNKFE
ncbi:MAG TPA: Imm30 family immunity protein [Phototrophicaceae bacterium]|jgi:hypothetical protein|nr:Imm30 family immunity protein [Phototrophicaceae bacterium]